MGTRPRIADPAARSRLDYRWQWVAAFAIGAVVGIPTWGFGLANSREAQIVLGAALVAGGLIVGRWAASRR
jgi:hypothetical protein